VLVEGARVRTFYVRGSRHDVAETLDTANADDDRVDADGKGEDRRGAGDVA
jgi:hypothetical protein